MACVLTWLGIKPQDLWGGNVSLAVPHWLWLFFAFVLFAFSIGLSAYGLFRKVPAPAQPSGQGKPKWQRLQWANTERERLEGEVRKWKDMYTAENVAKTDFQKEMARANVRIGELETAQRSMSPQLRLDPLQSDAIQLSGELLDFLRRLGPPPDPKYTSEDIEKMTSAQMKTLINAKDGDFLEAVEYYRPGEVAFTREGLENQPTSKWTRLLPWYQKLEATYSLEGFKDKVERLRNRFLLEGMTDNAFLMPIEGKNGVDKDTEYSL
ncbi:MAG: hypothetical protein ABSA80_08005 [Terriglobales bacterium]|jgi:hypothetical protein